MANRSQCVAWEDSDSDLEAPLSDSEASTQDTNFASDKAAKDEDLQIGKAMQAYLDTLELTAPRCEDVESECKLLNCIKGSKPQVEVHEKESNEKVRKLLRQALSGKEKVSRDTDCGIANFCRHCNLPIGDQWYNGKDNNEMYHAECMAQKLLQEMRDEEAASKQELMKSKRTRRAEYNIGWAVTSIPSNAGPAQKLACSSVPEGMCCLVLEENSTGEPCVRVAATADPAASVNLDYLSTALEVRRCEGREPLFSLESVDPTNKNSMQAKRFEPEWIAGTSLGEVMFQADYHLKELSMGECQQPVVGMSSCLDYPPEETNKEWYAREWFMVKDAEVRMSENNVLRPYVKMGVEAREQILSAHGLDDVVMTRKDHPMVKYAESFTNYFDLIAERKSVVFHLRETAKASILAKYLIDSQVSLEETWFRLAEESQQVCSMEVPQLWNEQIYSQICVKDGAIVDGEKGISSSKRGIYGGIRFGLDKFKFGIPAVPAAAVSAKPGIVGAASRLAPLPKARLDAPIGIPSAGLAPAPPFMSTRPSAGLQAGITARLATGRPAYDPIARMTQAGQPTPSQAQGVDLNLDSFNLSELKHVPESSGQGEFQTLDHCTNMGCDFWTALEGRHAFSKGDQDLLEAIFNPNLSDRRAEGDRFVPPNPRPEHMQKLRKLVKSEELLQQKRKEYFSSKAFVTGDPGDLFPASWTSTLEMSSGDIGEGRASESRLQHRFDYEAEVHVLKDSLVSAVPMFDKTTEDAVRFRMYRLGSLEVRTVKEPMNPEEVVAVFSVRAPELATMVCTKHDSVDEKKLGSKAAALKSIQFASRQARSYRQVAPTMGKFNRVSSGMVPPS